VKRLALALLGILATLTAQAERPFFVIEIHNHLFTPQEIVIPANTRVKLLIKNHDATPEEFESYTLNREKVIMGKRQNILFIGPLSPGEYPFFGEFHPDTAQGMIRAR